jgi:hypothetical protein
MTETDALWLASLQPPLVAEFCAWHLSLHTSIPVPASQPSPTAPHPTTKQPQALQEKKKMSAWVWIAGAGAAAFFVRSPHLRTL